MRGDDWEEFKSRLAASNPENVPSKDYLRRIALLLSRPMSIIVATKPGGWEAKAKCVVVVAWCKGAARLNSLVRETTLQLDEWRKTASDIPDVSVVRSSGRARGGIADMYYLFLAY